MFCACDPQLTLHFLLNLFSPSPAVVQGNGEEGADDGGDNIDNDNHVRHGHPFLQDLDSGGDNHAGQDYGDGNKGALV